jgi:hypothetical protein
MISCAILSLFISLHIFTSARTPPILASNRHYFPVNDINSNTSVDLDITLSDLQNSHRFLEINCTVLRRSPSRRKEKRVISMSTRTLFSRNFTVTNSISTPTRVVSLAFPSMENRSQATTLLHKEVLGYDTAQMKLTVSTDFRWVEGLEFEWFSVDPSGAKYRRVAGLVLSALHGYIVAVYASFLSLDGCSVTDVLCLTLGMAGVFSSDPFSLWLPEDIAPRWTEHIFLAGYVGLHRLFVLVQMEMLRSGGRTSWLILAFGGVFYAGYAISEAAATFDRALLIYQCETAVAVVLPSELFAVQCHMVHCVVALVWVILAVFHGRKYAPKRVIVFGVAAGIDLATTLFTQIFCVKTQSFAFTVLPEMIHTVAHLTTGVFVIFLMHPDKGTPRDPLARSSALEDELMVDAMTPGDNPDEAFPVS